MFTDTYETIHVTFEQTSVPGLVELGCVFAEGSMGNGCLIEIEGRENISITRNGLRGSTEYNISELGEYNLIVFDWDIHPFGPVLMVTFIVGGWPAQSTCKSVLCKWC